MIYFASAFLNDHLGKEEKDKGTPLAPWQKIPLHPFAKSAVQPAPCLQRATDLLLHLRVLLALQRLKQRPLCLFAA